MSASAAAPVPARPPSSVSPLSAPAFSSAPPLLTQPPGPFINTAAAAPPSSSSLALSPPVIPKKPTSLASHHRWVTTTAGPLPSELQPGVESIPVRRASAESNHSRSSPAVRSALDPPAIKALAGHGAALTGLPFPSSSPPSHPLPASANYALCHTMNGGSLTSMMAGEMPFPPPPPRQKSRSVSEGKEKSIAQQSIQPDAALFIPKAPPIHPSPSSPIPSPYVGLLTQFPSSSRVRVACELADTEATYVVSLHHLVRHFLDPLTEALTERRPPLSAEQLSILFSNAKLIDLLNTKFHTSVVQRLIEWQQRDEADHTLGDLIAEFAPYFKIYSQYCSTFDASNRLLQELTHSSQQSHAAFQAFLTRTSQQRGGGQSLASLLIQPIQRVPRYKLLLEQLLKHTPPSHSDLPLLSTALQAISVVASHINEAIRKRESMDAVIQIEDKFIASPGFLHASRAFLRQAPLIRIGKSASSKVEQFFLFNDLLASARTMMGKYLLKKKIPIDSTFMLGEHGPEAPAGPTRFHLLIFYHSCSCLSLYFSDAVEKAAWQNDLERCIQQAANTIQAGEKDREKEREKEEIKEAERVTRDREEEKESGNGVIPTNAAASGGGNSGGNGSSCGVCNSPFTLFGNRRLLCRQCRMAVCGDCSRSRILLSPDERKPERVCNHCASSAMAGRNAPDSGKGGSSFSSSSVNSFSVSSSVPSAAYPPSPSSLRGHHAHSPSASQNLAIPLADLSDHLAPSSPHPLELHPHSSNRDAAAHMRSPSSPVAFASDAPPVSSASPSSKPYPSMRLWDEGTVVRWLCEPEIGFSQFVEAFRRFHVDGTMLAELTEAELRDELGIREALHRKRLLKLIERLANGPTLPPPPPSTTKADGPIGGASATDVVPKGIWKAQYSSPPPPPCPPHLQSEVSGDGEGGPSSPSSAPTMPRRAAPALPQRSRGSAMVGNKKASSPRPSAGSKRGSGTEGSGSGGGLSLPSAPLQCGKCGHVDEGGLKFCTSCGSFLSNAVAGGGGVSKGGGGGGGRTPSRRGSAVAVAEVAGEMVSGAAPSANGAVTSAGASSSASSSSSPSRSDSITTSQPHAGGTPLSRSRKTSNTIAQRVALFQHPN